MNDGLLSQEEIDALLNGVKEPPALNESDKDLLGEIGNISMGSASTALSTIISKMVNITTPRVSVTTLKEIKKTFEVPNVVLEVQYTQGLEGVNVLLIKITDATVIADLMMGGDGSRESTELSEIEISAVSEAMNQMIGSSATSLATMLGTPINISPPVAMVWDDKTSSLSSHIDENEQVVKISFRLTIGELIDSEIMLLFNINTAKTIIARMTGGSSDDIVESSEFDFGNIMEAPVETYSKPEPVREVQQQYQQQYQQPQQYQQYQQPDQYQQYQQPVNVQKAQFSPLGQVAGHDKQNIELILDVPLEISVVLGRTKKTIKDILALGTGSLVELDKLTEEPVEILVNGKKIALGEVVVIDENFGVRITNIISNSERVKSLQNR